jgi:hypothetical protein
VIVSVKYVDTLPGAIVTIRNVGGQTQPKTSLILNLKATSKYNGAWPDVSGKVAFTTGVSVVCPYTSAKGIHVQTAVPELEAGKSVTMNIRFQYGGKDITSSLVDFATKNSCGVRYQMTGSSLSDYRYYIDITIHPGSEIVRAGAYLHPA